MLNDRPCCAVSYRRAIGAPGGRRTNGRDRSYVGRSQSTSFLLVIIAASRFDGQYKRRDVGPLHAGPIPLSVQQPPGRGYYLRDDVVEAGVAPRVVARVTVQVHEGRAAANGRAVLQHAEDVRPDCGRVPSTKYNTYRHAKYNTPLFVHNELNYIKY